ncbi:hypothetical protein TanjilG_20357 [Lupinus angustifolius]|uniref:Uncharacterized protein n=1 Tax=Lupinus angustifolius TaxID=3871 RepID=A0A4P1RVT9_LUPAN|nr:PREDICTED: uncharacterized protein LOC109348811 isoform X2 [Lupinus angustifolius]OIW19232.1 hypothetical protein TanjilG_20357 [Lupinus angustifolius]
MRTKIPTSKEEVEAMRKSIRCCISCILPCGALDVIRIVHSNGKVEEINGTIKAIDVMKANPKHILKKPTPVVAADIGCASLPMIVKVPPEALLQRGKIYFLVPLPPPPKKKSELKRRKRKEHNERKNNNINNISMSSFLVSDRYLSDILTEKLSMQRDSRRNGRVAVWRPHLESISELPCDM